MYKAISFFLSSLLLAGSEVAAVAVNGHARHSKAGHVHHKSTGSLAKSPVIPEPKPLVRLPKQVILPIEHWIGFPALTECQQAHHPLTPLAWKHDRIIQRTKSALLRERCVPISNCIDTVARSGPVAAEQWTDPMDPCHQDLPYYEVCRSLPQSTILTTHRPTLRKIWAGSTSCGRKGHTRPITA